MNVAAETKTALVGVTVSLNHAELLAIKGFIFESRFALNEYEKSKFGHSQKNLANMLGKAIVFFENIVPSEVTSVQEAIKDLFEIDPIG